MNQGYYAYVDEDEDIEHVLNSSSTAKQGLNN